MENIKDDDHNLIEIVDKSSLPFVIERKNNLTITLTPRIQGVSKTQREKFKQASRVCEIVVIGEEKIKKFENVVVVYPEDDRIGFKSMVGRIITTANKGYNKWRVKK